MIDHNQIGKIVFLSFIDPAFNNIWKVGNS